MPGFTVNTALTPHALTPPSCPSQPALKLWLCVSPLYPLWQMMELNVFVFQEEKVYVQHRVRQNAELLWDLIANKSACFYIAG